MVPQKWYCLHIGTTIRTWPTENQEIEEQGLPRAFQMTTQHLDRPLPREGPGPLTHPGWALCVSELAECRWQLAAGVQTDREPTLPAVPAISCFHVNPAFLSCAELLVVLNPYKLFGFQDPAHLTW